MSAGSITVKQSTDQAAQLHFFDANGADINITGKPVDFYVSLGIDRPHLIEIIGQTAHSDPSHGKTIINFTAAQLKLDARGYRYEVWMDGSPTDIGTFVVEDTLRGDA